MLYKDQVYSIQSIYLSSYLAIWVIWNETRLYDVFFISMCFSFDKNTQDLIVRLYGHVEFLFRIKKKKFNLWLLSLS